MMETKQFSLGAILSVTTKVLCIEDIGELYKIVNFMTGDSASTFQLPRFADECRPYLKEQLPELDYITDDMLAGSKCLKTVSELEAKHGSRFMVMPIHPEDHQVIDTQVELAILAPHIKLLNFDVESGEISGDIEDND